MSVGVFVILLTGWWILALGIIRIVHAFHLLKLKRESDGFGFGEMLGSNWWIALILGALLTIFGVTQSHAWAWRDRCAGRLQRDYGGHQPDLSGLQPLDPVIREWNETR